MRPAIFLLFPLFLATGVPLPAGLADDPAILDQTYMKELIQQLDTMVGEKTATPVKELREQLSRKSVEAKLPDASTDARSPAEIYDMRRDSVLGIGGVYNCGKCHKWHLGSNAGAVVLTADGIVVTNYHVVDSDKNEIMGVITHDKKVYPVMEVLAADKEADIAILRVKADNLVPAPLAPKPQTGEPVTVISHPNGAMFFLSQGYVARYYEHPRTGKSWMSITADFARGSSGGAVLDSHGNLCGIVANTNTITYGAPGGGGGNGGAGEGPVQMVVKNCVPVESIRSLFGKP
jgi:S1-C subfamily serine protease